MSKKGGNAPPPQQPQAPGAGVKVVNTAQIPGFKKWIIVYPRHLNSEFSREDGRKLSKENAVKNPSLEELAKASSELGLQVIIETSKGYPKDFFQRGRVRINMLRENGTPYVNDIDNKTKLLIKMAAHIKNTQPNRPEPFNPLSLLPAVQATSARKEEKKQATTTTTTTTSSSSSKGGKKKKNVNVI
ncbi:hypothetical protein CYY_006662 [Polysphondylium violaceum]|uniref:Signal recognition particle 19 kDa subunit n=1 Tax=Polysphondylium violaceum TaxID=133409 RepID=A0A8J4UYU3_9MYCE|nr:hypothetical protein CYY_006662 [Polysphondylium violaceum]